jgi:hypothetical protein
MGESGAVSLLRTRHSRRDSLRAGWASAGKGSGGASLKRHFYRESSAARRTGLSGRYDTSRRARRKGQYDLVDHRNAAACSAAAQRSRGPMRGSDLGSAAWSSPLVGCAAQPARKTKWPVLARSNR